MGYGRLLVPALLAALVVGVVAAFASYQGFNEVNVLKPWPPAGCRHPPPPQPPPPHPRDETPPAEPPARNSSRTRLDIMLWRVYARLTVAEKMLEALRDKGLPEYYAGLVAEAKDAYQKALEARNSGDYIAAYAWVKVAKAAAEASIRALAAWARANGVTLPPPAP